ncbi:MAG: rhomboid family intramembrane serine protease [bacterium]|nr:rhomboid family intramembrane serine protease [bacterium]
MPNNRLNYDTAWNADPRDAWVTITLIVVSTALSVQRFQGVDYDHLITDWRTMPAASWTLFTSALLHGSWMHLIFNLYWTFKFGTLVEAMFGMGPFVLLLLLLGAGSSAAQWALSGPGIGLSGIGYGLFGLMWALDRWHPDCRGVLDRRVAEMFGAWFLLCIIATWYEIMPVANTAHGAGFLLGALAGWSLAAQEGRRLARAGGLAGLVALIGIGLLPAVRGVVNRSDAYAYQLFNQGVEALQLEDFDQAAELYRGVLSRMPEMAEAWNNISIAYDGLGMTAEAAESYERSLELEAEREK